MSYHLPSRPARKRRVLAGLDLGKRGTPTALVVLVERGPEFRFDWVSYQWVAGEPEGLVWVTYVGWFALGVDYSELAGRIWAVCAKAGVQELWVDGTGVGAAVVEMLAQHASRGGVGLRPVTMTGGLAVNGDCVPRRELFARLAVEMERGRLRPAAGLAGWVRLREELRTIDVDGRRRGGRDDAAVALALACWGMVSPSADLRGGRSPVGYSGERPGVLF